MFRRQLTRRVIQSALLATRPLMHTRAKSLTTKSPDPKPLTKEKIYKFRESWPEMTLAAAIERAENRLEALIRISDTLFTTACIPEEFVLRENFANILMKFRDNYSQYSMNNERCAKEIALNIFDSLYAAGYRSSNVLTNLALACREDDSEKCISLLTASKEIDNNPVPEYFLAVLQLENALKSAQDRDDNWEEKFIELRDIAESGFNKAMIKSLKSSTHYKFSKICGQSRDVTAALRLDADYGDQLIAWKLDENKFISIGAKIVINLQKNAERVTENSDSKFYAAHKGFFTASESQYSNHAVSRNSYTPNVDLINVINQIISPTYAPLMKIDLTGEKYPDQSETRKLHV